MWLKLTIVFAALVYHNFSFKRSKYKIGFDAFNTSPSNDEQRKSEQLIFPLKSKNAIDKLGIDMDCVDAILNFIVTTLNITSNEYQVKKKKINI